MWSCLLLWCVPGAAAFGEGVHTLVTQVALEDAGLEQAFEGIEPDGPARIISVVDQVARHGAPGVAPEPAWVARFPEPPDAWAWKELLLFAPTAQIVGIDRLDVQATSVRLLIAEGARHPDEDGRNLDRLAFDAGRKPLVGADGGAVPADPALLNLGQLGARSSQAHAHDGLPDLVFSDDPQVLEDDPPRFAVAAGYPPGPVLSIAAEMVQIHVDLALLAGLDDRPGATSLMWLYTGQALHYLQDVCNPAHTVQVGLYDFFRDAWFARLWLGVRTGGGYLGPMRSLPSIGIDILHSHRTIADALTALRLSEASSGRPSPVSGQLMAAMREDDPELAAALDQELAALGEAHGVPPERGTFGETIGRVLIDLGAAEGAAYYRATRTISLPRYRTDAPPFDVARDNPDDAVEPPSGENEVAYATFWGLQERSLRRAGTAARRLVALEQRMVAGAGEDRARLRAEVARRLVQRQLRMLGEAEARRADWLARPVPVRSTVERAPEILAAEIVVLLAVLALVGTRVRRWRRGRAG